jgi:glycosyltransferase involved in cell wall biosynthesis
MKVTFVLPHAGLTGGIRVIATYANRLRQRGHDIYVVSIPKSPPTIKQTIKSLFRRKEFSSRNQKSAYFFDKINVEHKILDKVRPVTDLDVPDADVVIATWWETAEWVAKLSPQKGAKAYFLQHYEVHSYLPIDRVKATWKLPMHKITIAQWLVDIAQDEYGDNDVSLVPNSVDTDLFFADQRDRQPSLTVGMMYAEGGRFFWKGCDISLKAIELARQYIPDMRVVAFGSRAPNSEWALLKGALYVQKPSQSQLRSLYARCDAWLFGSRIEGFGLPILEAMACRTPVIGTPVGAAPELLKDGTGILVEPENSKSMADAIIKLSKMTNCQWRELSDAVYQKATSYSWENATDLFESALKRAVAKQKP